MSTRSQVVFILTTMTEFHGNINYNISEPMIITDGATILFLDVSGMSTMN